MGSYLTQQKREEIKQLKLNHICCFQNARNTMEYINIQKQDVVIDGYGYGGRGIAKFIEKHFIDKLLIQYLFIESEI